MFQKPGFIFLLLIIILISGCNTHSTSQNHNITQREQFICDSLKIDPAIIKDIRQYNQSTIEPFHHSLSSMTDTDGKEHEMDPIFLQGIVFEESNKNVYDLIYKLKDSIKQKGYTLFLLDANFDHNGKKDKVAVLKTTDPFQILKQIQTNGINYEIDNDSLITIMKGFDKEYNLELIGASGDNCEFIIHKEPTDWLRFAETVYKVCPDVVDQGAGSVEALADEMKRTKRLYFWWD